MVSLFVRVAQKKRRHFVVKQTALRAICEVVRRFQEMPVGWDRFADGGQGVG